MKRWFASLLVVTMVVLVFVAVPALAAAPAEPTHKELAQKLTQVWRRRLHESSQRSIDKLVTAGELTSQDGKRLKQNSDVLYEWYQGHSLDESAPCPHCGEGEFELTDHEYTTWLTIGYTGCGHNPRYNDQVQNRHVVNVLTCNKCGINYCPLSVESKVVCSHR